MTTTWDTGHKLNFTSSGGDLTETAASTNNTAIYSVHQTTTSQKVYYESTINLLNTGGGFSFQIGFSIFNTDVSDRLDGWFGSPNSGFIISSDGRFFCADSGAVSGTQVITNFTTGDTVDLAFDSGLSKMWARKGTGAWLDIIGGAQDPATNQGGIVVVNTPSTGPWYAFAGGDNQIGDNLTARFAQSSWIHTAPSGFTEFNPAPAFTLMGQAWL